MTHALGQYMHRQLGDRLESRKVVVFYDPRQEFSAFFERELDVVGDGFGLPRVIVGDELTFLATHQGSFFETRERIEPIVAANNPERLIVYVPGGSRTRETSVLMEIEKGGCDYAPQLRSIGREVLRKSMTDGEIDSILRSDNVTYDDLVRVLESSDDGAASLLKSIFRGKNSEELLATWLANTAHDADIEGKGASGELRALVESRIGLALDGGSNLEDCRSHSIRHVLINEFRADLIGDSPVAISMVPTVANRDLLGRVRDIASRLRAAFPLEYISLADRVEAEMGLVGAGVDPAQLGPVDTFRFEEQLLLGRAGGLIADREYEAALELIGERAHSFWADLDVQRQAQWHACRLAAELGVAVERVGNQLPGNGAKVDAWIQGYTTEGGWYAADQLHRRLEAWVAGMDAEPEAEQGLAVVRAQYDALIKRMAEGFTAAVIACKWDFAGTRAQTHVYPELVTSSPGRVAYFVVDSLRYEMGVELSRQLERALELTITPTVASLPSITPVGMAALLPEASTSLSVVAHKGKAAARINEAVLASAADRMSFLQSRVPDATDMSLGELLAMKSVALERRIASASIVAVRSQEIDFAGETDSDLLARQVMDSVIGNLVRAVNKLAAVGVERFVISADHGHLFSVRKEEDMKIEAPGGDTVELHRRCWIGRGGSVPAGAIRVTGAELGYDTDLDFIFPVGAGVFKAGGGLSYHHGGVSLQEIVVPALNFRMSTADAASGGSSAVEIRDTPVHLTNRTFSVTVILGADLFSDEPVALRVVLMAAGEQVGQAGMAAGAELDQSSGVLTAQPGASVSIGMMLTREDARKIRVVVLDPKTDAVLAQSDEIPVELGI